MGQRTLDPAYIERAACSGCGHFEGGWKHLAAVLRRMIITSRSLAEWRPSIAFENSLSGEVIKRPAIDSSLLAVQSCVEQRRRRHATADKDTPNFTLRTSRLPRVLPFPPATTTANHHQSTLTWSHNDDKLHNRPLRVPGCVSSGKDHVTASHATRHSCVRLVPVAFKFVLVRELPNPPRFDPV